ncbi:MAG TPA: hypothetical protein VFU02_06815 [Polyangiaceae bacterium]|nr:hypothetical protein [Polyangiaceae bacterium]
MHSPSPSPKIVGAGLVLFLGLAPASRARADGGYFAGSKGAHAAGRAGAATVATDDIMAAAINPAGLTRRRGILIQGGNRFSHHASSYERQPTLDWGNTEDGIPPYVEFSEVHNGAPWQLLDPLLGVAANLGRVTPAASDFTAALTVFAPPGVSKLEFPIEQGQRYMMVSREAQIITTAGTFAWQLSDAFSLGVSLHWLYLEKLDYELVIDARTMQGANPVTSSTDVLSRVSGSDPFTFNAVIGAWYRAASFLEVGLAGQVIPTSFRTKSTLAIEGVSPEFGDISLTRNGEPARDVSVELPLPLSARAGVRYLHPRAGSNAPEPGAGRPLFDVELDVVYETWSRVERFAMDTRGLSASWRGQSIDIEHIDIEKHWQNTWGVHLGGDFHVVPETLSVRGGVYYESAVAERAYNHVDFAGGRQFGGALGASVYLGPLEVVVAYEQRRQPRVTIHEPDARVYQEVPQNPCVAPYDSDRFCHPEYLGQPAPAVNAGSTRAVSHMVSLEALYEF